MFLELAIACKATAIVTRDGDLLSLHPFRSIPIITVTNFLKLYGEGL
jgi:predicted nucleic acid-binding protein